MPRLSTTPTVSISTLSVLKVIALLIGVGVLWQIRDIILYFFIAFLLAGVMYPFVRWCGKFRLPKSVSIILFYVLLFGLTLAAFGLLVPVLVQESQSLLSHYGQAQGWWLTSMQGMRNLVGALNGGRAAATGAVASSNYAQAFDGALSVVTAVFGGLAGAVIVLVFAFYFIVEEAAVGNVFRYLVPARYQEFASRLVWQVVEKLGGWLRGQLLLGLILAVLYFIGFSFLGLPYPVLLALFGGLLEFVPYLGPFISALPALFLAFAQSPTHALVTLIFIIVIQQLESNVIVPKVMQRAIGLNPIVSVAAFAIGAQLFGLVGAVFSIPVATALSVILVEVFALRSRRHAP